MTLYMIGLGLSGPKDITVKGLETVKACRHVYLENYTSRLDCRKEDLEALYGKKVITADRGVVETRSDEILSKAMKEDVAFLVIGDAFSATTHIDLYLRAKAKGIAVKVINNASILTAVGIVGLELYKYGPVTSLPFFEKNFEPETPYNVIEENHRRGLHTLVLLDIKADKDRYMTIGQAIGQLLVLESRKHEGIFTEETMMIGCARLGSDHFAVRYGKAGELKGMDFGAPLHCLIIPGKLHFMEEEMLKQWKA